MFWKKKKKSFCATCPERSTECLSGKCKVRQCFICCWHVDIGKFKSFLSASNQHQCRAPQVSDPVTGWPKESCASCRNFSHQCGKEGKYFINKEFADLKSKEE